MMEFNSLQDVIFALEDADLLLMREDVNELCRNCAVFLQKYSDNNSQSCYNKIWKRSEDEQPELMERVLQSDGDRIWLARWDLLDTETGHFWTELPPPPEQAMK